MIKHIKNFTCKVRQGPGKTLKLFYLSGLKCGQDSEAPKRIKHVGAAKFKFST